MTAIFEVTIVRGRERGDIPADVDARRVAGGVLVHMEGLMVVAKATRNSAVLNDLGPFVAKLLEGDLAPSPRKSAPPRRGPKPRRQAQQ